jgi:hypothetical protein
MALPHTADQSMHVAQGHALRNGKLKLAAAR